MVKNPLGEEKVLNLLVKFSVPAIVGMMVNALYNIVDRIFIGNSSDLGSNGIAGITVAFPLMNILMAIAILFGVGGYLIFLAFRAKTPWKKLRKLWAMLLYFWLG